MNTCRGPESSMSARDGSLVPTLALGKRASNLGLEAVQGRAASTDRVLAHVPMYTLAGISTDAARDFQVSPGLAHSKCDRTLIGLVDDCGCC